MMRKTCGWILLWLMLLLPTVGAVSEEKEMKEYQSPMGFTISVPVSWEISEIKDQDKSYVDFFENSERRLIVFANRAMQYQADTRIADADALIQEILERSDIAELIYTDETELDGYKCSHIQYTRNGAIRDAYYVSGDGIYAQLFFYGDIQHTDRILKSFRFSIPGNAVEGNMYYSQLGYRFAVMDNWRMLLQEEDNSSITMPDNLGKMRQETVFLYTSAKGPYILIGASAHELFTEYMTYAGAQAIMDNFLFKGFIVDENKEIACYGNHCFIRFSMASSGGMAVDVYVCTWPGMLMTVLFPAETPESVREYLLASLTANT